MMNWMFWLSVFVVSLTMIMTRAAGEPSELKDLGIIIVCSIANMLGMWVARED